MPKILGVGGVKMVEGDDAVRAKKCLAEIQETLMRYDCLIVPILTITPGSVEGNVRIIPMPRVRPSEDPAEPKSGNES
jgi:hypothetical protein